MSYRYDKEKKQKRLYFFGLVFLILSFFTPLYSWIFGLIERPLVSAWEQNNKTLTGAENIFQAFFGKTKIIEENSILKKEVERLGIDNLRVQFLADQLDTLYKSKDLITNESIVAPVLSHGGFGYPDTLIIGAGNNLNIEIGDEVISDTGILVGKIASVYDTSAHVNLYSKVGQQTSGILYPHNISFEISGYGQGSFSIDIPREVNVQKGDVLYSQQEPGTIIALVRDVVFDPRDPFKQTYLSYPINIQSIQNVIINKPRVDSIPASEFLNEKLSDLELTSNDDTKTTE